MTLFGVAIFWTANRLSRAEAQRAGAEKAEAEEKAVLRSILDCMGEAVIVGDARGRLVLFNPVAREILGLGTTDDAQEQWSDRYRLFLPNGAPFPPEQLPLVRAMRGERVDGVEVLVHAPGRSPRLHVSIGRPLLDADGKVSGGVVVFHDETERRSAEVERERLITDLQTALTKVKTLSGMLPICASCKKVRDDKGYWNQIESYIHEHTDAEFSHSICPECARRLYPEHFKELFPDV
jgi:PAS domain S-box-containing protein